MNTDTKDFVCEALRTESNDFSSIKERLSNEQTIRLVHAAMGLCTEAAEFLDTLKKHIFYGKKLDTVNLGEEIGDLEWYAALGVNALGYDSLDVVLKAVISKLKTRYPDKFSQDDALNRKLDDELCILRSSLFK